MITHYEVGRRDRIAYRLMRWSLKLASPEYRAFIRLGMGDALEVAAKKLRNASEVQLRICGICRKRYDARYESHANCGFYEPDEIVADIRNIYDQSEKGVTARPENSE